MNISRHELLRHSHTPMAEKPDHASVVRTRDSREKHAFAKLVSTPPHPPMTATLHASTAPGPIKIVALIRQGQGDSFFTSNTSQSLSTSCSSNHNSGSIPQGDQSSQTKARKLQAMCLMDPELNRITRDASRHLRAERFNLEATAQSIFRFVIEPAAIELSTHSSVAGISWFKLFPVTIRQEVARSLAEYVMFNALKALKDEALGLAAEPGR